MLHFLRHCVRDEGHSMTDSMTLGIVLKIHDFLFDSFFFQVHALVLNVTVPLQNVLLITAASQNVNVSHVGT